MDKFINYSVDEIKKHIITKDNWGSYFVIDNFVKQDIFDKLCKCFNQYKNKNIFTHTETPTAYNDNKKPGLNPIIGGAGSGVSSFDKLFKLSDDWKQFVKLMYSEISFKYFHNIFSETDTYKKNVSHQDIKDSIVSCKLSCQFDNYGYFIHPDASQKVVSYLLYLDKCDWEDDSIGGTDLWEVLDEKVEYDNSINSMDYKMRDGRNSGKKESVILTEDEAERVRKFKAIDFKPNRLVGFVRTDKSYHSIPPRILPEGITRDCFQINIWNLRSREE